MTWTIAFCLLIVVTFLYEPALLGKWAAHLVRRLINNVYEFGVAFCTELDIVTLDPSLDLQEHIFSFPFLSYIARTAILGFINPFDPRHWINTAGALVERAQLRTLRLCRMSQDCIRYIADSGATNHLSYRLADGDRLLSRQSVSTALGGTDSVTMTQLGHCIADPPKAGVVKFDELLSIGTVVDESKAGFHWTPDDGAWFDHATFTAPLVLNVENRTPYLTQAQYDLLRTLRPPTGPEVKLARFDYRWSRPSPYQPTHSLVLLGITCAVFDSQIHWFSMAYLVQFSPSTLLAAWRTSDRDPAVFLSTIAAVSAVLGDDDLSWGGPVDLDDYSGRQVSFMAARTRAPCLFRPSAKPKQSVTAPRDEPSTTEEFDLLTPEESAAFPDELTCSDDLANARRKGQLAYPEQQRVIELLSRGKPVVSADVCFPQHVSFGYSCIWVVELLKSEVLDGTGERVARLVLPFPSKNESFEELIVVLQTLLTRVKVCKDGFVFRTESEVATRHSNFLPWCAAHDIVHEKTQEHRHPSFEVAVGQVERQLRRLHFAQSVPGLTLWSASCLYLLYRSLKESGEPFGVTVAFQHKFPREYYARMAFSPTPGVKNSVVEPNGSPVIVLYPRWYSHNTVVGLIHSDSHLGLKLCELHFSELKMSRSLCFTRNISSTLMVRHYIKQPFRQSVVKKVVPPKHLTCAACVRGSDSAPPLTRGRPPKHTCDDCCMYAETHVFTDTDLVLRPAQSSLHRLDVETIATVLSAVTPIESGDHLPVAPTQSSEASDGEKVHLRRANLCRQALTSDLSDAPGKAQNDGSVPEPMFRRLVEHHEGLEQRLVNPALRRLCGCGSAPADVAAGLVQALQPQIRSEVLEAAERAKDPGQRSQQLKDGFGVRIYDIQTASEIEEPRLFALVLPARELTTAVANDPKLLEEVHDSGNKELGALLKDTLQLKLLEDVKAGDTVIPSLVIYTRKRSGRLKTRLVGCGNFQSSLPTDAVYSSTVDGAFWRLMLIIAIQLGWTAVTVDVSEAFTQSDSKDAAGPRTFCRLPSGWKGPLLPPALKEQGVTSENFAKYVLLIVGWLYGERGAPRAWRQTLISFLLSLDLEGSVKFVQSTYDGDIIFSCSPLLMMVIVLFVDDIWVFSSDGALARRLLALIRQRFRCTEPEFLSDSTPGSPWCVAVGEDDAPTFCAIQVYFRIHECKLYLVLSQREYLDSAFDKLVEKGVISWDELSTRTLELKSSHFSLDWLKEDCEGNPKLTPGQLSALRSGINTLSYAALRTRPDMLSALGQCARGQSEAIARERFLHSLKLLLQYAYTTRAKTVNIDTGRLVDSGKPISSIRAKTILPKDAIIHHSVYFDASLGCGGTGQDGFARQGCQLFVATNSCPPAPTTSKSAVQSTISLATCESELVSGTSAAREVVSHVNLSREVFSCSRHPTPKMFGDNEAANSIGGNVANLRKVRHLSLSQLWLRTASTEGRVNIDFVPSAENISDMLTKVLGRQTLEPLLKLYGLFELS